MKYYAKETKILTINNLGEFPLDEDYCFYGKCNWNDTEIDASFWLDEENAISDETISLMLDCVSKAEEITERAKIFICERYLDLANEWNSEEGVTITAENFMERIKVAGVSAETDQISISFNDDFIFRGHSLQAIMNAEGEFIDDLMEG